MNFYAYYDKDLQLFIRKYRHKYFQHWKYESEPEKGKAYLELQFKKLTTSKLGEARIYASRNTGINIEELNTRFGTHFELKLFTAKPFEL